MNSEKQYPDDYVEFSEKINSGGKELSWYIAFHGGNGVFVEFMASKDGISIREKEFWDGSVMRDEIKHFLLSDFSSGKTDEWIQQKLGKHSFEIICRKLSSEFGLKRPETAEKKLNKEEKEKNPEAKMALAKTKKANRMIGGGILLLLFACWMIWFPLNRLLVTIPQKFSWEIRESKGTVVNSGISEHTNYGKNTVTHVTNSWMKFSYAPEGNAVEVKLENVNYDSLVTGSNGKWWLNTYPPGKSVPVFYYKNHPEYASVGKENIIPGFFRIIFDFLLLFFGLICFYVSIRLLRGKI